LSSATPSHSYFSPSLSIIVSYVLPHVVNKIAKVSRRERGFEPLALWSRTSFSELLKAVEIG
jgi:hypothetical protein